MIDRRRLLRGSAMVAAAASMPVRARPVRAAVAPPDWAGVVEKAKKEGEVALYSSGVARIEEPRMKEFEQRLGIRVRYARPGGGEIVIRRFETEFTAGKALADVCTLTDTALGLYAEDKGYVAPIVTPNAARLDPAFKQQSPAILPTGGFCLVIAYNTRMLKPEQAPRSYAELADPRFSGQILFGAPENAGSTTLWIKAMVDRHGWGYVEKLRANQVAEMRLQAEAMQAVSRGEKPICVVAQAWAFLNMQQGAPVSAIFPADGVVLAEACLIVARNAPHPNAALLLADHLVSREYQQNQIAVGGSYGSAAGLDAPRGFPRLGDLRLLRVDLKQLVAQRGEIIDRWRRIMS